MKKMKILHIAPFNYAGVPMIFVNAERKLGHYSRLIVLGANIQERPGDIYLNLPFLDSVFVRLAKRFFTPLHRRLISYDTQPIGEIPKIWKPSTPEKMLIKLREKVWQRRIDKLLEHMDFYNFDIYQLDGGLGFYRDSGIIRELKKKGRKIVVCYTGSDLRTRGVIKGIDKISDVNITVEFDHLSYHPDIKYVPFPFDFSSLPQRKISGSESVVIGHAPTNRKAKGSDFIISVLKELQAENPQVIINLIEGMPYKKALEKKSECDIFIDQIGNLGYGINSIESMGMGIATCSCLAQGFKEAFPDNPFVEINKENLKQKLQMLINNKNLRESIGNKSMEWVREFHDSVQVVKKIHRIINISETQ